MKYGKLLLILAALALGAVQPAQAACWQWSKVANNNAGADPTINWAEGMSPSSINDSARAMMARSAECRDDISGLLQTTGGPTAFSVTTNQGLYVSPLVVPQDGQQIVVRLNVTNGTAPTLAADGGTIYPIQTSPGVAVGSGVLVAGTPYRLSFNLSATAWVLQDFYTSTIAPGSIVTAMLADAAVTRQKLYHPTAAQRLLGTDASGTVAVTGAGNNGSGAIRLTVPSTATFTAAQVETVAGVVGTTEANGTWTLTIVDATHVDLVGSTFTNAYVSGGTLGGGVSELALGTGLSMVFSTLNGSQPMAGAAGLTVTNNAGTPNTIIDVTADQAVIYGGNATAYAINISVSINTSVNGANGMDTGGRPTSGWVNVFLISNGASTAGLASLSATAPALPSGYTFAVRVGAMRTDGSQNFLRTLQKGNQTKYLNTIAANPTMGVANTGVAFGAVAVANFVPPTATSLVAKIDAQTNGAGPSICGVSAYQPGNLPNNAPFAELEVGTNGNAVNFYGATSELVLESSNVWYASSGMASCTLFAHGWRDKVNAP